MHFAYSIAAVTRTRAQVETAAPRIKANFLVLICKELSKVIYDIMHGAIDFAGDIQNAICYSKPLARAADTNKFSNLVWVSLISNLCFFLLLPFSSWSPYCVMLVDLVRFWICRHRASSDALAVMVPIVWQDIIDGTHRTHQHSVIQCLESPFATTTINLAITTSATKMSLHGMKCLLIKLPFLTLPFFSLVTCAFCTSRTSGAHIESSW